MTTSGAYLASQSLAPGGRASGADREYGLARDQEEIGRAGAEGDLQANIVDVAAIGVEAELAMRLEEIAGSRPPGDPARAQLFAEVAELRQLTAMRSSWTTAAGYVTFDGRGRPELDEAALRRGLRRNYEGFFPPRPEPFLVVASEARERSERLAVLILVALEPFDIAEVDPTSRFKQFTAVAAAVVVLGGVEALVSALAEPSLPIVESGATTMAGVGGRLVVSRSPDRYSVVFVAQDGALLRYLVASGQAGTEQRADEMLASAQFLGLPTR